MCAARNAVNSGAAGKLDGFSIVTGHEVEETITDPGAEDVVGSNATHIGGWYDTLDANENGDKVRVGRSEPVDGIGHGFRSRVRSATSRATQAGRSRSSRCGATRRTRALGYCAGAGDGLADSLRLPSRQRALGVFQLNW